MFSVWEQVFRARCIPKFSLTLLQKFCIFQYTLIMYDLEYNFVKIHLPDWQFDLPRALRQWDMYQTLVSYIIITLVLVMT